MYLVILSKLHILSRISMSWLINYLFIFPQKHVPCHKDMGSCCLIPRLTLSDSITTGQNVVAWSLDWLSLPPQLQGRKLLPDLWIYYIRHHHYQVSSPDLWIYSLQNITKTGQNVVAWSLDWLSPTPPQPDRIPLLDFWIEILQLHYLRVVFVALNLDQLSYSTKTEPIVYCLISGLTIYDSKETRQGVVAWSLDWLFQTPPLPSRMLLLDLEWLSTFEYVLFLMSNCSHHRCGDNAMSNIHLFNQCTGPINTWWTRLCSINEIIYDWLWINDHRFFKFVLLANDQPIDRNHEE